MADMIVDLTSPGDDLDSMGPVDYIVIEFPGNRMTGEGFPLLLDLVDRGVIRILDLLFVRKDADGTTRAITFEDLAADGAAELAAFEGASAGLIGPGDVEDVAVALAPDSSAGVLIYENTWAAPFAAAVRRGGGQLVSSGRIPAQDLLEALDGAEADARSTTDGGR